jgi:long-chain acyl-CoA synthetase
MATDAQVASTAVEVWRNRVSADRDRVAYRYRQGGGWQTMTWGQADEAAREIAAGLASLGVGRGDTVCLLSQTRVEWVLCDVGILLAGAATVPIYASNTGEQCAFIARDAGAKVIIAEDAAQLEKVLPLAAQMPGIRFIHISGDCPLEKPDAKGRTSVALKEVLAEVRSGTPPISLEELRASGRTWAATHGDELERRSRGLNANDLFTIIYTSGTTGNPKGVVLTHENLVSACQSACRALTMRHTDLQYLFLPLAHVLGRELEWVVVVAGCQTAFSEGLAKIKDNLVEVQPTFMAGVPRIYEKFYNAVVSGAGKGSPVKVALVKWGFAVGKRYAAAARAGESPGLGLKLQHALADKLVHSKLRAKLGLDRCRFLVSGGAPLAAEIAEFFHGVGLLILEGYGLTETMAGAFFNTLERYRFGTVGPVLDVVEYKIAEDGEVLMRGPSVFKRYHNNSAATAEAIDPHGWFHSGDIGQIEDGFLRITDRKKDLIVTAGGKKIPPQVLENAVKMKSSLVSQVMVHGDKRPYLVALVTLTEDAVKTFGGDPIKAAASAEARAAVQQAIDAVNGTLASYETIKSFTILPADFTEVSGELTPSMKVKRKVVTDRHRATLDGMYAVSNAAKSA